jgi:hypothetical protein
MLQHNGGWILQRLHHKTDLVLISFPFGKKTAFIQIITKNIRFFISFIFYHRASHEKYR